MTREEAIAKGVQVQDTQHSMKRRSPWHNYCQRGTYMLTLVVEGRRPLLGRLVGSSPEEARIEYTPLGHAIRQEEVMKIPRFYPMVEVWKLCIMPDHIHMIVRVKSDLPEGKHLGQVIGAFMGGCSRAARRLGVLAPPAAGGEAALGECPRNAHPASAPNGSHQAAVRACVPSASAVGSVSSSAAGAAPLLPLFEPGYNDKLLLHEGQLSTWRHYLSDNPRRLMMKRMNPHLFTVLHDMEVAGRKCQIVGNRFLLDIPDKVAVIVHRRYTDEVNARLREEWLACGERGGVLVSAAIAPKEKEVLREAMNRGYRIILLRENGFPELYKPSGESFDACSCGLLLQISPWQYHMDRKVITRAQCLELNDMATAICG